MIPLKINDLERQSMPSNSAQASYQNSHPLDRALQYSYIDSYTLTKILPLSFRAIRAINRNFGRKVCS